MKKIWGRRRLWEFRVIWEFGDSHEYGREGYEKLMGKGGNKGRETVGKEFQKICGGYLNIFLLIKLVRSGWVTSFLD